MNCQTAPFAGSLDYSRTSCLAGVRRNPTYRLGDVRGRWEKEPVTFRAVRGIDSKPCSLAISVQGDLLLDSAKNVNRGATESHQQPEIPLIGQVRENCGNHISNEAQEKSHCGIGELGTFVQQPFPDLP